MNETRPIRWGILSTARIATKVVAAIHATSSAEATAVASRAKERAAKWAADHDIKRSYADYESLVADEEIDAIYIPLPPSMHAEWTIRCAESGKHVLCEKPLALNANEAEEMAAACRENQVQLMDAVMWVHHPRSQDMLKPIKDGSLGELRRVTSAFSFDIEPYLTTKPPHMAVDPITGQASEESVMQHELRFSKELGGGSLLDLGWYNARVALWAFDGLPRRVFAVARYRNDVDVNMNAMLWYDDERVVSFDCGYDMAHRKWFEVSGHIGSIVCDDFLVPWDLDRPRFWRHEGVTSTEHKSVSAVQEQCMIENFCNAIRSGVLNEEWPQISVANQRVCDAVAESARTGNVIEIA